MHYTVRNAFGAIAPRLIHRLIRSGATAPNLLVILQYKPWYLGVIAPRLGLCLIMSESSLESKIFIVCIILLSELYLWGATAPRLIHKV